MRASNKISATSKKSQQSLFIQFYFSVIQTAVLQQPEVVSKKKTMLNSTLPGTKKNLPYIFFCMYYVCARASEDGIPGQS